MKILIFLFGIGLLGPAIAASPKKISAWELYKLKYDKFYSSISEERHRMNIFYDHFKKVVEHNKRFKQGLVSFETKLNRFSDMKTHEVTDMLNGYNKSLLAYNGIAEVGSCYIEPEFVELAPQVDWRTKGAVTPIKDQGQCGSCWAFSATGSLEGQHFRKTRKLVSLSEQNLIDCSSRFGNNGCEGGLMDYAFKYIKQNHGIDTESSYPYMAEDESCSFNKKSIGATDNGYVDIESGNEKKLMSAVATIGPISVAIDAGHDSFLSYKSGIYYEPECSSMQLDHGVLVVGYGTENGKDYWLVKNSWGEDWGDSGYIKMARNHGNNCGIATAASYPLV